MKPTVVWNIEEGSQLTRADLAAPSACGPIWAHAWRTSSSGTTSS